MFYQEKKKNRNSPAEPFQENLIAFCVYKRGSLTRSVLSTLKSKCSAPTAPHAGMTCRSKVCDAYPALAVPPWAARHTCTPTAVPDATDPPRMVMGRPQRADDGWVGVSCMPRGWLFGRGGSPRGSSRSRLLVGPGDTITGKCRGPLHVVLAMM